MNSRFVDRLVSIIIGNDLIIKEGEITTFVVEGKIICGWDPAMTYIYELYGIKFFNIFDLTGSTKATNVKYAISDKYAIKNGSVTNLLFSVLTTELRKVIDEKEQTQIS